MALRNIVTVGDPVLTKVCRPVTKFDDRLSQLIDDMIETLHDANGAGLAAPQIGVLRRVVIVNTEGEDWELVNPEIVEVSEEERPALKGASAFPQVGPCDKTRVREGPRAGPARRLVRIRRRRPHGPLLFA